MPLITTTEPAVAAGEGRRAVDDHDAVDGAFDGGVGSDDDERVDVIAGGDVDVMVDGQDEAAEVLVGLGGERGGRRQAEQDRDGGEDEQDARHVDKPLGPGRHRPGSRMRALAAGRSGQISRASRRG